MTMIGYNEIRSAISDDKLKSRFSTWKSRHSEEEAIKRLLHTYDISPGDDISEGVQTLFKLLTADEGSHQHHKYSVPTNVTPIDRQDIKAATPSPDPRRSGHSYRFKHISFGELLPNIILISLYSMIFALTSGAMADVIVTIIGESEVSKYAGYFMAFIFDITIFMLIGATFDSTLSIPKRFLTGIFGLLLMASTFLSTIVTIETKSEDHLISLEQDNHKKLEESLQNYKDDEYEAKAHYYQIVYRKNWQTCLENLGPQCQLRGYRTLEAVTAKSNWNEAKRKLNEKLDELELKKQNPLAKKDLIATKAEKYRTEAFVAILWLLALMIKWYQKSIVPALKKDK